MKIKEFYANLDSEHKAMLKGAAIIVVFYIAAEIIMWLF